MAPKGHIRPAALWRPGAAAFELGGGELKAVIPKGGNSKRESQEGSRPLSKKPYVLGNRWNSDAKEYVVYCCRLSPGHPVCLRRYGDFSKLRELIHAVSFLGDDARREPRFPAKSTVLETLWGGNSPGTKFIEERQKQLRLWLNWAISVNQSLAAAFLKLNAPKALAARRNLSGLRVVFLGHRGSGKTCILKRCHGERFNDCERETISFDFKLFETQMQEYGKGPTLLAVDTSGNVRYREINTGFFRGAHCFVLVYDASRKDGLQRALDILSHDIRPHCEPHARVILCGSKLDLTMAVPVQEAKGIAKQHMLAYTCVSAKTGEGCGDLLSLIGKEAFDAAKANICECSVILGKPVA